ncbi:hypothetical protein [Saccharopolyspora tripterygii]
MRKLVRRARSRSDYAWYLAAREWPLLVMALGVLLGALVALPVGAGAALALIVLVLGAVLLTRDVRGLRGRWSGFEFSPDGEPFPRTEIAVPAAYPAPFYSHLPGRGTALLSDEIDHAVRERRFDVRVAEQRYRPAPRLRATAPHLPQLRSAARPLLDRPVVGLRSDPLPGAGDAEIRVHRARSFDVQCSNDLCGMRIADRETGEEFDPRRRLRESTGLSRGSVAGTELTGFARWMERGAKPEFFGITRLSASSNSIRGADLSFFEVDLATLRRELRTGAAMLDAPSLPVQLRETGSLRLLLAVRAAALR